MLSARTLARLPPEILREARKGTLAQHARSLPLGLPLDEVLPDGGLLRGDVVELAVAGGSARATSIALAACAAAQREHTSLGTEVPWCAFVDPSGSLYGPGVADAGVSLERLLVVRPPVDAVSRIALRLVESQVFSVVVVDAVGPPGASLALSLRTWERTTRRLSIAATSSQSLVLLLTDLENVRPLPLPVSMRLEISRPSRETLSLCVAKEKRGRTSELRRVHA